MLEAYLAVWTPTCLRLFNGLPLCHPDSDFDAWTTLLSAGKGIHKLYDLRNLPAQPPKPAPKVEPSKPAIRRLWNNRERD